MRTCALAVLLLGAACGSASQPGEPVAVSETAAAPPAPGDPCATTGSWQAIAPVQLPGRVDHTAVWTGSEMVMWGGTRGTRSPLADGARYQPASNRWLAMSGTDVPMERDDHAAVWTGSEMIVWGGRDDRGHTGDGARYSPSKDAWVPVNREGAPEPREDHSAVWTGTEMIVWGGWNGGDTARNYALDGGRYDPKTDRWRPISRKGAPEPREDHSAIWTGREMIVWGGVRREQSRAASGDDGDAESIASPAEDAPAKRRKGRPDRHQLATGGRYDPATDTWTAITLVGAPEAREDGVVVWTGTDMLVWGGQQGDVPLASGARYVPGADTWCPIASDGAPVARRDVAGVWAGDELVVWGGRDPEGEYVASGAAFVP